MSQSDRSTWMRTAALLVASGWALVQAGAVAAQECAGGLPPFGSIGVGQFECVGGVCSVNMRNGDPYGHSFSTEPRLRRIDPDGPAAGQIEDGDILVAVEDRLITTVEGGRALGSLEPGEPIKLTLRRDGRERDVRLTPRASCEFPGLMVRSGDRTAWAYGTGILQKGWVRGDSVYFATGDSIGVAFDGLPRPWTLVPSASDSARWRVHQWSALRGDTILSGSAIDSRSAIDSTTLSALASGGFTVVDSVRSTPYTVTGSIIDRRGLLTDVLRGNAHLDSVARAGDLRPPAELGIEIRCGDCGFRLRRGSVVFETEEFPVIVAIEEDGPGDRADMRVGDILLTVGGRPITGGRTLGALRPDRPATIEVRRDDRIVEVTVTPRGPTPRRQRW